MTVNSNFPRVRGFKKTDMGKVPNSATGVSLDKAPQSSMPIRHLHKSQQRVKTSGGYQISWQLERTCRPVCWWTQREEFIEGKLSLWHTGKTELAWSWTKKISITMRWCNLTAWHDDTIACNLWRILQVISVLPWNIYFAGCTAPPPRIFYQLANEASRYSSREPRFINALINAHMVV